MPTPLLTVSGGASLNQDVAITDAGRAVLNGELNRLDIGIDRWFGGVHVRPENLWRWDDESQRIGRA